VSGWGSGGGEDPKGVGGGFGRKRSLHPIRENCNAERGVEAKVGKRKLRAGEKPQRGGIREKWKAVSKGWSSVREVPL